MIMRTENYLTIESFLKLPLENGTAVLERFAALPNAVCGKGAEALQRYVYIPGTRKDRVVLVAHVDTVWDAAYEKPYTGEHEIRFADGVFSSGTPQVGIGADDRAGCAMLWALRDCGHSILLLDGEEHGKHGARYLRQSDPRLFRELNKHRFMMELDWMGTNGCLYNQVENTQKFKQYIETVLKFSDSKRKGGTDLQILCKSVCGVNIGIGYHGWHSEKETLVLSEWENTLSALQTFLCAPQKKFPTIRFSTQKRFIKRVVKKLLRIFHITA